jgi:putative transposase
MRRCPHCEATATTERRDRTALGYRYRAVDRDGNLVDVLSGEKRDKAAAQAFFRSARTVIGLVRARVTSDRLDAYPGAMKAT